MTRVVRSTEQIKIEYMYKVITRGWGEKVPREMIKISKTFSWQQKLSTFGYYKHRYNTERVSFLEGLRAAM